MIAIIDIVKYVLDILKWLCLDDFMHSTCGLTSEVSIKVSFISSEKQQKIYNAYGKGRGLIFWPRWFYQMINPDDHFLDTG